MFVHLRNVCHRNMQDGDMDFEYDDGGGNFADELHDHVHIEQVTSRSVCHVSNASCTAGFIRAPSGRILHV